jgi:hypothetical protein
MLSRGQFATGSATIVSGGPVGGLAGSRLAQGELVSLNGRFWRKAVVHSAVVARQQSEAPARLSHNDPRRTHLVNFGRRIADVTQQFGGHPLAARHCRRLVRRGC